MSAAEESGQLNNALAFEPDRPRSLNERQAGKFVNSYLQNGLEVRGLVRRLFMLRACNAPSWVNVDESGQGSAYAALSFLTPASKPNNVQMNVMHARQLQNALGNLSKAICEAETILETMRAEHDPLASHIFVSRRQYQQVPNTTARQGDAVNARP